MSTISEAVRTAYQALQLIPKGEEERFGGTGSVHFFKSIISTETNGHLAQRQELKALANQKIKAAGFLCYGGKGFLLIPVEAGHRLLGFNTLSSPEIKRLLPLLPEKGFRDVALATLKPEQRSML